MKSANPFATILSAAMMLGWLGDRHNDESCLTAVVKQEKPVAAVLEAEEVRTADLGGKASTSEIAEALARCLE